MGALIAIAVRLLSAFWGLLASAWPALSRVLPWLSGCFPAVTAFLKRVWARIAADAVEKGMQGATAISVRAAGMVAWGIFLGAFFTGINGLAIRDICMTNPFSGFPGAIMFLVVHAFPVKFAFALCQSYVIWKFTYGYAALVMSRTVKWLFGF